ncbi:hypothetical protein OIDMADRAFT_61239 [Oidiodendron maius Zn]|uniref:ABM domain-containing protein n=1 Tax=Oidiodendron maius (strain Zn) TaxID=913774 RepID=A0A0C3GRJ5_OIDMZ|nr:hypothetical protein OIDMADRAFT_61239 [Oidiodendron maius Zn]
MASKKEELIILVRLSIAPENIPVFLEALHDCFSHCLEEPECERFEIFQNSSEGEFCLLGTWRESKQWFIKEQLTKPYYEPYLAVTRPLWVKDLSETNLGTGIIEYLEPVPVVEPFFRAGVK